MRASGFRGLGLRVPGLELGSRFEVQLDTVSARYVLQKPYTVTVCVLLPAYEQLLALPLVRQYFLARRFPRLAGLATRLGPA